MQCFNRMRAAHSTNGLTAIDVHHTQLDATWTIHTHVFVVYYFAMQFGFESSAHMTQDTDTMRSHVRELKS